ncbi:MAG: hypothetical protein H6807_16420 [Planctomycetes bacterium]|nr:hypothetical protein [Planctomycetota bacterium]
MTAKPQDICFDLKLVEPLLFGDNRAGNLSTALEGAAQDLSPLTIFGCVGKSLLDAECDDALGEVVSDIMSPPEGATTAELLAHWYQDPRGQDLLPRPLNLPCRRSGSSIRIDPGSYLLPDQLRREQIRVSTGATHIMNRTEIRDEVDHGDLLVDRTVLENYLTARPQHSDQELVRESDLLRAESRVGLRMDNDRNRPQDGMLFNRPYRRPRLSGDGAVGLRVLMRLRAPVDLPTERTAFLGGDRRRVRLRTDGAKVPLADLRDAVVAAELGKTRGFLAYLLTPSLACEPPEIEGRLPVACVRGRAARISGWNTRGWPRPLETLVPRGSVFFYAWGEMRPSPEDWQELVGRHWLTSVSPRGGAAGFGRILLGLWS